MVTLVRLVSSAHVVQCTHGVALPYAFSTVRDLQAVGDHRANRMFLHNWIQSTVPVWLQADAITP